MLIPSFEILLKFLDNKIQLLIKTYLEFKNFIEISKLKFSKRLVQFRNKRKDFLIPNHLKNEIIFLV